LKHFEDKYIDEIQAEIENNYFTPVIKHTISHGNYKKVCDIGCGNGIFSASLKNLLPECKLTGVDSSLYALRKASQNGFDEISVVKDFSNDLIPFESNSFDLIICKDVLEHLVNPVHLVKEMYRLLNKDGKLLIHVPNHFPIWGRWRFLLKNNIDTFSYFKGSDRHNFPHIRFYTYSSIVNMVEEIGFNKVENISYFFSRPPKIHRLMSKKVQKKVALRWTDDFCQGITLIIQK
jgi:SAM-dependent methyltransferase